MNDLKSLGLDSLAVFVRCSTSNQAHGAQVLHLAVWPRTQEGSVIPVSWKTL